MNEKMSEIISNLTIVATIPYVVLLRRFYQEYLRNIRKDTISL